MGIRLGAITGRGKGFTLIELLAVMGILGVLAAIVSGSVGGFGPKSQAARLAGDEVTVGNATDQFYNDAYPQSYPVVSWDATQAALKSSAGDLGIRLLDMDARLPGNPSKSFVPDYLKDIPNSASLVSWRIDQKTGRAFFAQDGSLLVPPSDARLGVSTDITTINTISSYTLTLKVKKNQAATKTLKIQIPRGYSIGGQALSSGVTLGNLSGSFDTDNPWDTGQTISFTGTLKSTGSANSWTLDIPYDTNFSPSGSLNKYFKDVGSSTRRHTVTVIPPTADANGLLTITMDRATDPDQNQATETWVLTISGSISSGGSLLTIVKNPATAGVYRWLTEQHSIVNLDGIDESVTGNQSVVIK